MKRGIKVVTIIKFFSLAVLFAVYLIIAFLIIGLTGVALIKIFKWLCDLKDRGEQ
jgi:hypothetical protein